MKRMLIRSGCLFGTIVLGLLAMNSCSTSTVGGTAPPPTNRMARLGHVKIDTLNVGYRTYQNHCIRCHTDDVPKPVSDRAWHPGSMGLSLYSSLTAEQRYGVIEYLKAVDNLRFNFGALQDS